MRGTYLAKRFWPKNVQQMTWTSLSQLEEALFHYFESVVIFYQSVEQQWHPNSTHQVLPLIITLKSIIKIQSHLFQMSTVYLSNFEHINLQDEYVQYSRTLIKLNERLDELWKSISQSSTLQTEIGLQFKQFKHYFIKKKKLMQTYGHWV